MGRKCRACIIDLIAVLEDIKESIRKWEKGDRDGALIHQGDVLAGLDELKKEGCVSPTVTDPLRDMVEKEHLRGRVNRYIMQAVWDGLWSDAPYDIGRLCQAEEGD